MGEMVAAFSAGLLSMTSPCVFPLYPGFLAYLSGHAQGERQSSPVLLGFLVLCGVVSMMLMLGALIAAFSVAVSQALIWITPVAYGTIILLGTLLLFDKNPFLRLTQIRAPVLKNPYANAFVYGLLYGPIALPCSGAQIGLIFALSVTATEVAQQIGLFFVFGLGFGMPLFLLAALNRSLQQRIVRLFVTHHRTMNLMGGVLLVGVGLWGLWQEWESLTFAWHYRNL